MHDADTLMDVLTVEEMLRPSLSCLSTYILHACVLYWLANWCCMHAADTLVDVLTVEEMLMYTAELKRPIKEQKSSKKAAVDGLIDDLGLDGCRNVKIGNSMNRGISGGQVEICLTTVKLVLPCLIISAVDMLWHPPCVAMPGIITERSNSVSFNNSRSPLSVAMRSCRLRRSCQLMLSWVCAGQAGKHCDCYGDKS